MLLYNPVSGDKVGDFKDLSEMYFPFLLQGHII